LYATTFEHNELISIGGDYPVRIVDIPTHLVCGSHTTLVGYHLGTDAYRVQLAQPPNAGSLLRRPAVAPRF
jgi:hypothetical protein